MNGVRIGYFWSHLGRRNNLPGVTTALFISPCTSWTAICINCSRWTSEQSFWYYEYVKLCPRKNNELLRIDSFKTIPAGTGTDNKINCAMHCSQIAIQVERAVKNRTSVSHSIAIELFCFPGSDRLLLQVLSVSQPLCDSKQTKYARRRQVLNTKRHQLPAKTVRRRRGTSWILLLAPYQVAHLIQFNKTPRATAATSTNCFPYQFLVISSSVISFFSTIVTTFMVPALDQAAVLFWVLNSVNG